VREALKRVGIVVLVLVVAVGAFLFFPRGGSLSIANAATLTVLHGNVDAQKGSAAFAPALDGDLLSSGDVVRANDAGNAVLTFFDGSTLTVQSGAQVKVASLNRTGSGGIQVTIEQTLGKTWASVQKLTGDSKFEIKTPSSTAAVRGTAFETDVEIVNGVTTTTIKTDEGTVLVTAEAGGTTSVPAGSQVSVPQGAQAPANPIPQPPGPRLRFTSSANFGYTVIDPNGLQCGSVGRQIPGCDVNGASVTVLGPVPGTWTVFMTAAAPIQGATLTLDGARGDTVDFTTKFTTNFAVGDLVRTSLNVTAPAGGKLASTGFSTPELVTTVCGAEAKGKVFSSGPVADRANLLSAYAKANSKQPAAIVLSATELTQAATDNLKSVSLPVTVSGLVITIDRDGMKLAALAAVGPLNVPASASIIAGTSNGKLILKTRDLDLGPAPGQVKDQVAATLDKSLTDFAGQFQLVVDRVAFRGGCMAVIGTTP
jgi:hypothetical protein